MSKLKAVFTIKAVCPDSVGIIAAISTFIAQEGGWISEAGFHSESEPPRFFLRLEIMANSLSYDSHEFSRRFAPIAEKFAMEWQIIDNRRAKKAVIFVSKQGHCLYDLLGRCQAGDLDLEIPLVISNHPDFAEIVERHGIEFIHIPVTKDIKTAAFAQVVDKLNNIDFDVLLLARYMQILPAAICQQYSGKIINIHHSFLPSFIGADPYRQAFERGVKLIGATCHYVTEQLDQGPIIEQDVVRIDHSDRPSDLIEYGKDIEKIVLARGLRFHLEDRVFIHGNKTIVFR